MAPGTTTISGGSYAVSDTAGIEAFIESVVTSTMSGASIFTYPAGANKIFVGVVEQKK